MTPKYDPREALRHHHRNNAAAPINGYDDVGFWRESYWAQCYSDAVPIVVDANILHDCIGRSAKRAEPTALVTIANTRGARIYCAAHVIDEFVKYHEVWAGHYRVSAADYQDAFFCFYRPLLRIVPTEGLEEMLLPEERARLDVLRAEDSDDVPTATLAIALGAVPITKDHAPWKAVHGAPTDAVHLDLWLSRLMSIGDRAETEKLLYFSLAGVAAPGVAAIHWGTKLYRYSPLAFGITAAFVAGAAFCVPRPAYRKGWDAIKTGAGNLSEAIMTPHVQANGELLRELPPFPKWDDLVETTSRDAALARACLYSLARSRQTPATVGQVVDDLPALGIGQEASRVGRVLRRYPCFAELAPQWWQIGHPYTAC